MGTPLTLYWHTEMLSLGSTTAAHAAGEASRAAARQGSFSGLQYPPPFA